MAQEDDIRVLQAALDDPAYAQYHDKIRQAMSKLGTAGAPPEIAARKKGLSYEEQQAMTHQPGEGRGDETLPAYRDPFPQAVAQIGRGIGAVASAARHPIDTASDPAKMRQFVRGGSDVFLGYPTKIADALHANLPANFPGQGSAAGRRPFAETEAEDTALAPNERTGGALVTMLAPNPVSLAGRIGAAGAGAALSRVPVTGIGSGAGMGVARGLLGYELSAPAMAALHADSSGNRLGAVRAAATDPFGIIAAGTLGAVGGAGRGNAARIRDPRTESGRVIRDIEQGGGPGVRINKFGEPVSGGIYDSPELQNLPVGKAGTTALADRGVSRLESANVARLKAARAQYGDAVDDVIAAHGDRPHPTTNAHAALDQMQAENTVNGVTGDEGTASAINKVRRMMTQQGADIDEEATLRGLGLDPAKVAPAHRAQIFSQLPPELLATKAAKQISAGDMVKARKIVRSLANNAQTPSENRVYQVVLGAMDKDAELIDPRIKEMNAAFSRAMVPIEQSNEIMFGKQGREPELSEAQRRTGIANLSRIGEDTQAAMVRNPAVERFEQLGPEYQRETNLMRAKTAQERLRRGPPETATTIEKSVKRAAFPKRTALGMLAGPLAPIAVPIGYAMDKYAENPLANRVRLGLPASEAVGKMTGRSGVGMDAVARIARNRGKKKRESEEASP